MTLVNQLDAPLTRLVGRALRPSDVFFLSERNPNDIAAQHPGQIEVGSDVAQGHRTFVRVLRDREIPGDHGHIEPVCTNRRRLVGNLIRRSVNADLRRAHAKRMISAVLRHDDQVLKRQRGFTLVRELLADADRNGQFHTRDSSRIRARRRHTARC